MSVKYSWHIRWVKSADGKVLPNTLTHHTHHNDLNDLHRFYNAEKVEYPKAEGVLEECQCQW